MMFQQRSVRVSVVRGPDASAFDVVTAYIDAGDGHPIVMVHGSGVAGSGRRAWEPVLCGLSEGCWGIAPDMIWSGWSTIPDMPYSLMAQVDHLTGFLDALAINSATIVGQSMGAYIAARFACDHPGRTARLLLVASNTVSKAMGIDLGPPSPGRAAKNAADGTPEAVRELLQTTIHRHELISDEMIEESLAIANRPGMDTARCSYREFVERLDSDPPTAQLFDLRGRLDRLTLPMSVVWGLEDVFAPVTLGRQLHDLLPRADYHEVPDAGHHVFRDQPEQFMRILEDFLQHET